MPQVEYGTFFAPKQEIRDGPCAAQVTGADGKIKIVEFGRFCVYSVNERRSAWPSDDQLSRLTPISAMV